MQIEPASLTFEPPKTKQLVTITNTSSLKFIFKVKVTNTQLFTIYPGRGYLQPQQTVNINITLKHSCSFNAKILVQHAPLPDQQELSWSQIDKPCIKDHYITMTGTKEQHEEKPEKQIHYRKTQSPLYESQIMEGSKSSKQSIFDKNMKESKGSKNMVESNGGKSVVESIVQRPSTGTIFHSLKETTTFDFRKSSVSLQKYQQIKLIEHLQEELKNQQKSNTELRKKLKEDETKLNIYKNESQKRINSSMTQKQQGFKLGHLNIILLALICIIFGFLIARTDTPTSL